MQHLFFQPYTGRTGVPWYDAKKYGAKGDGSTDDTAAIQAIIDAMPAGGGKIFFPAGEYVISSLNLTGKLYITLQGEGGGFTNTSFRFTSTTGSVFNLTNARFIVFKGFSINPTTTKTAGAVFLLDGTTDSVFEDLRISSGFIGFDIVGNGASDLTFRHIRGLDYSAVAWSYFIRVGSSGQPSSLYFEDVVFTTATSMTNQAIFVANVDTMVMRNCAVQKQSTADALGFYATGGEFIHLEGCFFECGTTAVDGILIAGATNVKIEGCHVSTSFYGIRVTSGKGITIIGCRIYFNYRNGINLAGGEDVSIVGCQILDNSTVTDNTWDAIVVAANVSDFVIVGNTIGSVRGTPEICRYGIYITDGTTANCIIRGNRITDYGTGAIYDGGTGEGHCVDGNQAATEERPLMANQASTADATVTTLWSLGLLDERVYYITATVLAQKTDGSSRAAYQRTCLVYRDAGGGATIQGQSSLDTIESVAAWDCTFDVSANTVRLRVTGAAATNIKWRATVEVRQLA